MDKGSTPSENVKAGAEPLSDPGPSDAQQREGSGAEASASSGVGAAPPIAFAPGAPMGTPFWASPELDVGLPHDQSVDIWSVGITFVELITGIPPYYDTSPEGLRRVADPAVGFVPRGLPEVSEYRAAKPTTPHYQTSPSHFWYPCPVTCRRS